MKGYGQHRAQLIRGCQGENGMHKAKRYSGGLIGCGRVDLGCSEQIRYQTYLEY